MKYLRFVYMTLFMLMTSIESKAWEGNGTESSPYLISNCEQMKTLALNVNKGVTYRGKFFKVVVTELDFNGNECIPIGGNANAFSGTFDGNGVVIKNFVYNNSEQSYISEF